MILWGLLTSVGLNVERLAFRQTGGSNLIFNSTHAVSDQKVMWNERAYQYAHFSLVGKGSHVIGIHIKSGAVDEIVLCCHLLHDRYLLGICIRCGYFYFSSILSSSKKMEKYLNIWKKEVCRPIPCLVHLSQSARSNSLYKPTLNKSPAWSLWKIKNTFFHYSLVMMNGAAYLCKFPSLSPRCIGSGGGGSLEQNRFRWERFLSAVRVSGLDKRV